MSKTTDYLLSLVGSKLESIIVEIYRYEGESQVTINDVQLSIGNTNFVLGCSGNGSVFIQKGIASISNCDEGVTSSKLFFLERCSGYDIDNIEIKDTSIVFDLSNSKLEIVNDDDELVVICGGKKLCFDNEPMGSGSIDN